MSVGRLPPPRTICACRTSELTQWTSSVTTTTALGQPLPLGLLLSDGDHCRIQPGDFQGRPACNPRSSAITPAPAMAPSGDRQRR